MEPWMVGVLAAIAVVLVGVVIYFLTREDEKKEKKEEDKNKKDILDKAMMQGDCEEGGNVKNKDNPDIAKGKNVTDSLKVEIGKNSANNAVSASWWTNNKVCQGDDNVFRQLVVKPKGRDPITYGPVPPEIVDTTISKWNSKTQ